MLPSSQDLYLMKAWSLLDMVTAKKSQLTGAIILLWVVRNTRIANYLMQDRLTRISWALDVIFFLWLSLVLSRAAPQVRIRGRRSSMLPMEPLYVVDGIPHLVGGLRWVSHPQDINLWGSVERCLRGLQLWVKRFATGVVYWLPRSEEL